MSSLNGSSRRRYGTPLPMPDEPLAGRSPQAKKAARDSPCGTERCHPRTPPQSKDLTKRELGSAARKSYESNGLCDLTTAEHVVIQADSWLPYFRLGRPDYRELAATLEYVDNYESPSSDHSSIETASSAVRPSKQIAEENRPSKPLQPDIPLRGASIKPTKSNTPPSNAPARVRNRSRSNIMQHANAQLDDRKDFDPPLSSHLNKPQLEPSPALSKNRSQRLRRIRASYLAGTQIRNLRNEGDDSEDVDSHTDGLSSWRPPSVWYECVDGVILSTRPKSRKENGTGLSIPEIEAHEIQNFTIPNSPAVDERESIIELLRRNDSYAEPPPPIGVTYEYVRTISPRPVLPAGEHVFVDRYSRSTEQENANDSLTRSERSKWRDHLDSPSQRAYNSTPELRRAEHDNRSERSAAESPEVPRYRSIRNQSVGMTTRTDNTRSLLSTIRKTFSSKSSKNSLQKRGHTPKDGPRITDPPRISLTSSSSRTKSDTWSSMLYYDNDNDNDNDSHDDDEDGGGSRGTLRKNVT